MIMFFNTSCIKCWTNVLLRWIISPFGQISRCHNRDESSFKLLIYSVLSRGVMTSLAFQASTAAAISDLSWAFSRGREQTFFFFKYMIRSTLAAVCVFLLTRDTVSWATVRQLWLHASPKTSHSTDLLLLPLTPRLSFSTSAHGRAGWYALAMLTTRVIYSFATCRNLIR